MSPTVSQLRFLPFVLSLTAMVLGGCDSSRQGIAGKWKTTVGSSEIIYEFFDNGTVTIDAAPGRYSFGDQQRIKIQTKSATFVHQIELTGDRMIWTAPNGIRTELRRIK